MLNNVNGNNPSFDILAFIICLKSLLEKGIQEIEHIPYVELNLLPCTKTLKNTLKMPKKTFGFLRFAYYL